MLVTNISPQKRFPDGSISSELNYKLIIEDSKSIINTQGKVFESQLIKFGEEHNFPGITINWSYKSDKNIYIQSGYRGQDAGTYICVTNKKIMPTSKLSNIFCKYAAPLNKLGHNNDT